ncbi:glutamate racemase [Aquamicrobium terrae]
MIPTLHRPVAVFDAGIGSYAIVAEIHKAFPSQDILYFADRASFPYGGKGRDELLAVMRRSISFLSRHEPSAIVIASNAPSIMVLDELRGETSLPLFGVHPPLERALAQSGTGRVGILGVQSLVESPMLAGFVAARAPQPGRVALINASPMVELVEDGSFLFDPAGTQRRVDAFMRDVGDRHPGIDVFTLSSTHLPWLAGFFAAACPKAAFLDPAADVVAALRPEEGGSGAIAGLVTESPRYDLASFRAMLDKVGVEIPLAAVTVD